VKFTKGDKAHIDEGRLSGVVESDTDLGVEIILDDESAKRNAPFARRDIWHPSSVTKVD